MKVIHNTKETLRSQLKADCIPLGINNAGFLAILYRIFLHHGYLAIFLYRLSHACSQKGKCGSVLAKILWRLNVFITSADIDPKAKIGSGLYLPHPVGIVIGEGTIIGNKVTLFQNVTFGLSYSSSLGADKGYPLVGDKVKIFAGAVITGNIKIGNNAVIGANAVVIGDVPENKTAVGVPARIVKPETKIQAT